MEKVKIDIGRSVNKIYHFADIHIRNLKRHKEYRQVFEKLYNELKNDVTDNSLIYLGGDIVHAKTDMSPELIDMVQDFFKNLADIAPTILIAGNHDCNLNNESRLDALTPIVKALDHDNFHYLRDSGVYEIGGCNFIVWSIFDKEENFIDPNTVKGEHKIVLFHGCVNNSQTDYGFELENTKVTTDMFDGCDLGLLGDIHLHQFLDKKERIGYSSSLIQQNHGEKIDNHGYVIWDLDDYSHTFKAAENDYGYVTLEVDCGEVVEMSRIPKKPRLRIKFSETDAADIKKIVTKIKKKYEVQDVVLNRVDTLSNQKSGDRESEINFGNIRDVNIQNKLIKDYLDRQFGVEEGVMNKIYDINNRLNQQLPPVDISRNVIWSPKKFEFSNMFSYGEDNVIDFGKMKGSFGLFAPNTSGKSSLLDALTFCCFDRSSRATKGGHIMNTKKNTFWCKFNFEINGLDYYIERKALRKKGHVRIEVNFWVINETGERVSLNGEQRKDTNTVIKTYLGEYEDFILTTLSLQNNNASFIEMPQRERKELLAQFLDINIFDDLYDLSSSEIRDVQVLIKNYQNEDFSTQLVGIDEDLKTYTNKLLKIENQRNKLITLRDEYRDKVLQESTKLVTIDKNISGIQTLREEREDASEKIAVKNKKLNLILEEFSNAKELLELTQQGLDEYDEEYINDMFRNLTQLESNSVGITNELEMMKIKVDHKLEKLHRLEEHEYDPECQYCMNNIFVKDAIQTKQELDGDKLIVGDLKIKQREIDTTIEASMYIRKEKDELDDLQTDLKKYETLMYQFKAQSSTLKYELESLQNKLTVTDNNIAVYYKQEDIIKSNVAINSVISDFNEIIDEADSRLSVIDTEHRAINSDITVIKNDKNNINTSINKLKKLENEYIAYEYYMDAVKRDGVPYELITRALPKIENEVNSILTGLVDFNIILNTDGKNINALIAYDEDTFWPLELTSGMEKFISSLAIRTSLISITSLPRPNFIAIDEGFGTLDSNNLNSIFMLFDYLKSRFDFFITISHLDTMRDLMDHLIEIKKENSYSKIQYNT